MLKKHLKDCNFEKYFKNLIKQLKGKKVVIYGTGMLFELINDNYDLSKINIIGISDIKYHPGQEGNLDFGYKIIPLNNLEKCEADVILLGVQNYDSIMEEFEENYFVNKPTKIVPLVKIPFFKRIKDIIFN